MRPYLNLLSLVLADGTVEHNRTGVDAISYFGTQSRYDLADGFPLVTTKKMYWKGIVAELLWFLKGDTNIQTLVEQNVHIWDAWPFQNYLQRGGKLDEKQFLEKIKTDDEFAEQWGDLGPVYGKQWRDFNGVDQIGNVIEQIKADPTSRRLIVSAWNPVDVPKMALPPCHTLFQFSVHDGVIDLQLYQRSADLFLGVPFNIASYALLLMLVADVCGLKPGTFVHTIGVAHIYVNHLEQVKTQLNRMSMKLPQVVLKNHHANIWDYTIDDIELVGYESWPALKGAVAV